MRGDTEQQQLLRRTRHLIDLRQDLGGIVTKQMTICHAAAKSKLVGWFCADWGGSPGSWRSDLTKICLSPQRFSPLCCHRKSWSQHIPAAHSSFLAYLVQAKLLSAFPLSEEIATLSSTPVPHPAQKLTKKNVPVTGASQFMSNHPLLL